MRNIYVLAAAILLTSCATSGGGSANGSRSFSLKNGSKIVFTKSGCIPDRVKFINASDKNVRVTGTVIASNANENKTIDEFMLSCSPAVAGGSSSCSLYKMRGSGGFYQYGGLGCPDMQFKLININAF